MERIIDVIRLRDGRDVRREPDGRYREITSGKWVSAEQVETQRLILTEDGEEQTGKSGQELIQEAVVAAARQQGLAVSSPDEAFAEIVGVQAEIALDKNKPSHATTAARFVIKEAGLAVDEGEDDSGEKPWFLLGRELAQKVLEMVEEEIGRRSNN
jgi:hypothetical protein